LPGFSQELSVQLLTGILAFFFALLSGGLWASTDFIAALVWVVDPAAFLAEVARLAAAVRLEDCDQLRHMAANCSM
jgi:small-conductance mechanosensitive channel